MSYNVTLTLSRTPAYLISSYYLPVYGVFYNGYYLICYWDPSTIFFAPECFTQQSPEALLASRATGNSSDQLA